MTKTKKYDQESTLKDYVKQAYSLKIYFDSKNGNNHIVPLSLKAITILQQRQHLPSPFPMANGTLHGQYATLKQKAGITNLTWHDLRHTFATLAIKGLHAWQKTPMPI